MSGHTKTLTMSVILILGSLLTGANSDAWSNGGKSASTSNPDYGTHDWIAQHALDWLPSDEKQYILNNLDTYLYGTELPDFSDAVGGGGIGDTQSHHAYYRLDGRLQDDSAANRARSVYSEALSHLRAGDLLLAARTAGTLSHYIADLAAFPHVMGSGTDWGEEDHHQDYENYVNARTDGYSVVFDSSLAFDGSLEQLSAYDAVLKVAHDTTFDDSGQGHRATWMNANYNRSDPAFSGSVGRSLNVAVNVIADVLHTLWVESGRQPDDVFSWLVSNAIIIVLVTATFLLIAVAILRPRRRRRNRRRRR